MRDTHTNPEGEAPTGAKVEPRPSHIIQTEIIISNTLRFGVGLSFAIIFIGSVLLFVTGAANQVNVSAPPIPRGPGDVLLRVTHLDPAAIVDLGLMLLILTPVFRVAVSVIVFALESDYVYTVITIFVLAVLLTSFFLGRVE